MPNPKPQYPQEFREEAVRIYHDYGRSLHAVSTDLGISLETLHKWVNQARSTRAPVRASPPRSVPSSHAAPPGEQDAPHGAGPVEKSRRLRRTGERDRVSTYRFIAAERGRFPVRMSCRHLGVSPSAFYDWCSLPPSRHEIDDRPLTELVREIHEGSRGTYGAPGIWAELRMDGIGVLASAWRVS